MKLKVNTDAEKPTFESIYQQLPKLLQELVDCTLCDRNDLADVPQKGIYLFQERGRPLYVGRTNRMRERLMEHGRNSASHYDASFAYRIAKEEAQKEKGFNSKMSRKDFCSKSPYKEKFSKAKARVAKMQMSYVSIEDPYVQTIFEVYAALKLDTPYNHFDPT